MKSKYLLVGVFLAGILTGCLSEPDFEPVVEDGLTINLDASVNQVATRVNAQGFEDGDALGLYAVNYENSNQTPGILLDKGNQADHIKYVFSESDWKWTPVKPVYYKDANTLVDLYVFYPYAEPSVVNAYNFEVQKDQSTTETQTRLSGYEASDFMWGKVADVAPAESAVKVRLEHKMAGAYVILKKGTGFDEAGDWDLLDKKVLVTNTTRKANIDLSTGEVTPIGGAQATGIVMAPQSDGSFRAIVVPQTIDADVPLFSITIGGVPYGFGKAQEYSYVAGKLSQFTITINRKYPSGEYELVLSDNQILDWKEDINTHEGEARQYYCVHCDDPGTLGRLIKADKRNPDKIRNLKVSGKISDEDFYFMRDSMAILEAVNLKECNVLDVSVTYTKSLPGHDDESGNSTVFATRESGTYDDVIPDYAFKDKTSLYYLVFPENITDIGMYAFNGSSLSGTVVLPDKVINVWGYAFTSTNIVSVVFPSELEIIGPGSFQQCSFLSSLSLPGNVKYIGWSAFRYCQLSGKLILPDSLEYIGAYAFSQAGNFMGGLKIPPKIRTLYDRTFEGEYYEKHPFSGTLDLNNVTKLGSACFCYCQFVGELIIPEGVTEIPNACFYINNFSVIQFPSTLKTISSQAFRYNERLCGHLKFPDGFVGIGSQAFENCRLIQSLELSSTLQVIQPEAFDDCYYISSIVCNSTEPPIIQSSTFNGVPKDNFTVEVPANAVKRYQADSQWGEFKRISAHYDFSISRSLARTLNAGKSRTYLLRAPANYDWKVESKPDWVTVSPSSGTGKTEVTVTFAEMADAEVGTFEVDNTTYKGRAGEIVFLLNDKDYRSAMTVEQYDYEYADGDVVVLNEAAKGNGVDLVFLADCYDAKDIADGTYLADIQEAYGYYFDLEPYKTYKDYFNVYAVIGESDDSGMGTVNTIRDAKFGSQYSLEGISPDFATCYEYAKKADSAINPSQTLIVIVENTTDYGGICYMWGDGSAVACCPKSADAYPYDFRGIVQHEAGGHGFGKLADEYIYHNAFIQSCGCPCCPHIGGLLEDKARGWSRNIEATGDVNQVGWSHLIFHPDYSDYVDIFEGGYFHSRGVYRSEPTSCMNNNIPYYSAISRQAIVERIMEYAGEEFTLEKFYANDSDDFGPITKSGLDVMPVEPIYDNGKQFAPKYMGDKPDFLK